MGLFLPNGRYGCIDGITLTLLHDPVTFGPGDTRSSGSIILQPGFAEAAL